jgi:hypothetical protein
MDKPERNFNTIFRVSIDDVTGLSQAKEVVIDISKISDDELDQLLFKFPEATQEIVYRELFGK